MLKVQTSQDYKRNEPVEGIQSVKITLSNGQSFNLYEEQGRLRVNADSNFGDILYIIPLAMNCAYLETNKK